MLYDDDFVIKCQIHNIRRGIWMASEREFQNLWSILIDGHRLITLKYETPSH